MRNRSLALLISVGACLSVGQSVCAQDNLKVGRLRCEVSAGLGLIITSTQETECTFTSTLGFSEHYFGKITKFGLDIGVTDSGILAWDVLAPSSGPNKGALAGNYVGVTASVTTAAGVGANALIGGFGRSITLQPLSLDAQTGLALAAGVAELTLRLGV